MTLECCGKPVTTNFCPDCGRDVRQRGGLHDLLRYLRQQEAKARTHAKNVKAKWGRAAEEAHWPHYSRKLEAAIAKWADWAEALEQAISTQAE